MIGLTGLPATVGHGDDQGARVAKSVSTRGDGERRRGAPGVNHADSAASLYGLHQSLQGVQNVSRLAGFFYDATSRCIGNYHSEVSAVHHGSTRCNGGCHVLSRLVISPRQIIPCCRVAVRVD